MQAVRGWPRADNAMKKRGKMLGYDAQRLGSPQLDPNLQKLPILPEAREMIYGERAKPALKLKPLSQTSHVRQKTLTQQPLTRTPSSWTPACKCFSATAMADWPTCIRKGLPPGLATVASSRNNVRTQTEATLVQAPSLQRSDWRVLC